MIEIHEDKCDLCGCCVGVCPENCIDLTESRISIVHEVCTNCRKCEWACPFEVFEFHRDKVEHVLSRVTA
jgi:NAD-dependent dihydropyrimidine dehydrogenase PreA subunit